MENHSILNLTHKQIVDELKSDYTKQTQKLKNENSKLKTTNQELLTENRNLKCSNQDGKMKLDRLTKLHDRLSRTIRVLLNNRLNLAEVISSFISLIIHLEL